MPDKRTKRRKLNGHPYSFIHAQISALLSLRVLGKLHSWFTVKATGTNEVQKLSIFSSQFTYAMQSKKQLFEPDSRVIRQLRSAHRGCVDVIKPVINTPAPKTTVSCSDGEIAKIFKALFINYNMSKALDHALSAVHVLFLGGPTYACSFLHAICIAQINAFSFFAEISRIKCCFDSLVSCRVCLRSLQLLSTIQWSECLALG